MLFYIVHLNVHVSTKLAVYTVSQNAAASINNYFGSSLAVLLVTVTPFLGWNQENKKLLSVKEWFTQVRIKQIFVLTYYYFFIFHQDTSSSSF